MCLTTKKIQLPKHIRRLKRKSTIYMINKLRQKAKTDIVVYKWLVERRNWSYKEGKIVSTYLSPHRSYEYHRGTHYYQTGTGAFTFRPYGNSLEVNAGLHAYTKRPRNPDRSYFKMIVPKGSTYFISWDGKEIVSDNLIFPAINR